MALPAALIDEIRTATSAQEVDAQETIRALAALVGDDDCLAYIVWNGPGFGQEALLFDVYVLGRYGLYNYGIFSDSKQGGCLFLDAIQSVGIVNVSDPYSPYILVVRTESEHSRIFGGPDDLHRLEAFRSSIILARQARR